ncbi:MAG: type I methionyl aminopeptidase [Oscillospiraceae bacterium]|nr:type I methionyl aminopeptidase [Oscillospiraceae bacterium]
MIQLKSERELTDMRRAGHMADRARRMAGEMVVPGITTAAIDREVRRLIELDGGTPSFLDYNGFPGSSCISINDEVIHGIPGSRKIQFGDIVSVDVGAFFQGFHGDCAATFGAGELSPQARMLINVTRQSFFEALAYCREGYRLSDISYAVQAHVESRGFSVVRDFVGHGIGRHLHEPPEVPNFGQPGRGVRLQAGMTLAIEPMINMGSGDIIVLDDGWTVRTSDGSLSAHYENTVLITDGEPEILTRSGDEVV